MHVSRLTQLFVVLAIVLAWAGSGSSAADKKAGLVLSKMEKDIVDLTNKERAKQKLPPLKLNLLLFQTARKHSANMAKQNKLAHELDGKGPFDRMKAEGYDAPGGENCAAGQKTAAEAVAAWMADKGHREAILDEAFTAICVGAVPNAKGMLYYTQDFGKAKVE